MLQWDDTSAASSAYKNTLLALYVNCSSWDDVKLCWCLIHISHQDELEIIVWLNAVQRMVKVWNSQLEVSRKSLCNQCPSFQEKGCGVSRTWSPSNKKHPTSSLEEFLSRLRCPEDLLWWVIAAPGSLDRTQVNILLSNSSRLFIPAPPHLFLGLLQWCFFAIMLYPVSAEHQCRNLKVLLHNMHTMDLCKHSGLQLLLECIGLIRNVTF